MVLVSFVLVVVAAITLVIGLLQSGLGIIYVSIGCSVLAGLVLFAAVLRGRPEPRAAGAPARPAPQGAPPREGAPAWQSPATTPAPEPAAATPPPPPPPPPPAPEREPAMAGAPSGAAAAAASGAGDRTEQLDAVVVEEPESTDDGFPIHNYDKLRATEILPMLAELDDDQLEDVRAREQAGKNRFMILSRIDDEVQTRQGEGWGVSDEAWEGQDDAVEAAGPGPVPAGAPPAASDEFPIPGYDQLRALDVLGRLPDLSYAELQQVREREQAGARRAMILNRIDRLAEETGPMPAEALVGPPPEEPPPAGRARSRAKRATKAPAIEPKRTRAKATKAPQAAKARAAGAAKVGGRARKAPAPPPDEAPVAEKAAPAKKAAASRKKAVPAEKATGPLKKVAAKKAAAKKVGAPRKKAAAKETAAPLRRTSKRS